MTTTVAYKYIPERPDSLTATWVTASYQALEDRVNRADAAADAGPWIALAEDWNALKGYVQGEDARISHAYAKDMRDEQAELRERNHRETVTPASELGSSRMVAALLASPHKDAVGERFGQQFLRVLEVGQEPLATVNSDLRVKAGELAKRYDKLIASGEVTVAGEQLTLAQARGKTSSEDASLRKQAYLAYYSWFEQNQEVLASIYHEQVALRNQMGLNLGHSNFVPLGYAGMERTDYGPEQVQQFRDAVRRFASPLFARQAKRQAAALGTPTLKPWDRAYHPELSLPSGVLNPVDGQLEKLSGVFTRLSPKLSAHFERMRSEGLIDLENRKGKGAGAYCTSFPDEGRVAIFCNSTGDESDIGTLTHEMGHAFQGWESQWIESVDLQWPTSDACEVHSMGMEFLSMPYLDEFFTSKDLQTFTKSRWNRAVEILCYVCVVDEFQHWVYENPSVTSAERDEKFMELQSLYMPGVDWTGEAESMRPLRWYAQLHIYRYPFYYIDYAIAETGAMQLALMDQADHEACLETYMELCRLGGTQSVTQLFAGAGLRSPFDAAVVEDLMAHAAGVLGL
ncbi:MAG: M3 family oligoendopeptidase [Bacteroidia bacterium]|jgi:M3 family oligoendopeptidase